MTSIKNVDYNVLDKAKNAFIKASRSTLNFAEKYGFVPGNSLGGSANIFSLNLLPYLKHNSESLYISLIPEGLGTADDARPEDLTPSEKEEFWRNIGIKTVSSLTNDACSSGLQTILVGLYLPSSTPELVFDDAFMSGFLSGFVEGCREVGCVYLSGETPQLKNKIYPNKLDIAGALFAISPPGLKPIDGNALGAGDYIILVESSGPHENGFTVLRELAEKLPIGYRTKLSNNKQYWQAINAPSKLYTKFVQDVLAAKINVTAFENITGHGWQKLMRSSKLLKYNINNMLPIPEVFNFVEKAASYSPEQMIKIFNYGAGFAVFVKTQKDANLVVDIASKNNLKALVAGVTEEAKQREVFVAPLNVSLKSDDFALSKG
jgi:phosphoribosylformylglycinamidine cyclo-ligase